MFVLLSIPRARLIVKRVREEHGPRDNVHMTLAEFHHTSQLWTSMTQSSANTIWDIYSASGDDTLNSKIKIRLVRGTRSNSCDIGCMCRVVVIS